MTNTHRPHQTSFRWADTPVLEYKQAGAAPFKDVTRQVLFESAELGCQLRYFEVEPGGHTTLEKHAHVHAVMVIRGNGRCLVGDAVFDIALHDLVTVPPHTWHQFRASEHAPLGFLCMVNRERDRPVLPDEETLAQLRKNSAVAAFIRV